MSDNNDPFSAFESDRTVIKPSAGRKAAVAGGGTTPPAPPPPAAPPVAELGGGGGSLPLPDLPGGSGLNPLLQAAAPLLAAAPRIRTMLQHPNPAGLRAALIEGVRKFEAQARAAGLPNEQVVAGRYVLCTLLDESASGTPWGGQGAWSTHSLLVAFHNEAWGGEKVFQLMGKLAENVPANRNLLELIQVTLAMGLEGRFRVLDNGRAQLEAVREKLAQMLRQVRGPVDKELSPQWAGVGLGDARLRDGIPVWVVAAAAALLLMLLFVGLRFAIHGKTDDSFATLAALDVKRTEIAPPLPPPPAPKPRLASFLEPEVKAGLVEVRDFTDRSVIIVRGDGFFEPGSADVAERVKPLIARIGAALNEVPGGVVVTGHTDNQPIRSIRYPSNWHLSQERAMAVKTLLSATVKPERIKADGRADSEPLEDNATPAGRAKNRRVEITLTLAPNA